MKETVSFQTMYTFISTNLIVPLAVQIKIHDQFCHQRIVFVFSSSMPILNCRIVCAHFDYYFTPSDDLELRILGFADVLRAAHSHYQMVWLTAD